MSLERAELEVHFPESTGIQSETIELTHADYWASLGYSGDAPLKIEQGFFEHWVKGRVDVALNTSVEKYNKDTGELIVSKPQWVIVRPTQEKASKIILPN